MSPRPCLCVTCCLCRVPALSKFPACRTQSIGLHLTGVEHGLEWMLSALRILLDGAASASPSPNEGDTLGLCPRDLL